jgi:bifunctional UDP-N-acetylglucosamine pyrophosphorylase/glucosamine-1-phosphate N-acetyltransferase
MVARDFISKIDAEKIVILYADTPLICVETLIKMNEKMSGVVCLGFVESDVTNKYGRLVTNGENLLEIVEYKDASDEQRKITICNSGVFCVDKNLLLEFFDDVKPSGVTGEFYLTDIAEFANRTKKKCIFVECDKEEVFGVNSREDLAVVDSVMQKRIKKQHMQNGVTFLLPETTYVHFDAKISRDVVVQNCCFIGSGVILHEGVEVRASSYIEDCEIDDGAIVGPFARVRGKTKIGKNSRIGNFVEIKNTQLGNNSKANHLAYIGDCEISDDCNIGAGTVFCNYNGFKKFKSKVGKGVFVGSNSTVVSPVEIGEGAIIGAGSVVTKDVEPNAIVVARAEQKSIKDGAVRFRKKNGG